ncbi:MAG TPA: mechanosensitive ion channel family protein, partial [Terriglobales bacterium]|nr:mechanosensitive ion channel family protein [Terriglobales bacterium]
MILAFAAQTQRVEQLRTMADDWREDIIGWSRHKVPKLIAILVLAIILLHLLRFIVKKLDKHSKTVSSTGSLLRGQQLRTLASITASVGAFTIYFMALLQVLPLFGVDVKPILASAGIVGLAVGFGAQTLVKDVINGFFILFENQFDIGDVIKAAGVSGTVEVMTLRKTVLRDANGTVHVIPNSEIKVVSNTTRDWSQVSLHVTVDYSEPSERIINLLREVAVQTYTEPGFHELMVAEPEVPGIERVSGSDVDYLMLVKVLPGQQYRVSRELRRRIKESFEQNKVKTPGPPKILLDQGTK